jgi:hypothetical protein
MAVMMILAHVTPSSVAGICRRFGGTYCPHHLAWEIELFVALTTKITVLWDMMWNVQTFRKNMPPPSSGM